MVQGFIFAEAKQGKTHGLAGIAAFAASRLAVRSFVCYVPAGPVGAEFGQGGFADRP